MRIQVKTEVVRSNLELLKYLISGAKKQQDVKDIDALVEKATGGLMLSTKEIPVDNRWKLISIRWVSGTSPSGGTFEIYEQTNEGKTRFSYSDLSEEACQTLADTIHTVNHIFSREFRDKGVEGAFVLFAKTHFISPGSEVLDTAFYDATREQAEKLLSKHPFGTFLFRADSYAQILEEELSIRFEEPIRCFTLTFVAEEGKIRDYTIIDRLGKFQIYKDDILLEKTSFVSIDGLIDSIKDRCKFPLRKK